MVSPSHLPFTMSDAMAEQIAQLEAEAKTVVCVLYEKTVLGMLALRDAVRSDASASVVQLKKMGIEALTEEAEE